LHIFEDRYKEMMAEVLRDRMEFGVVLASDQGIANEGCTATVDRVLRKYDDGRMDLLTLGRRRFEIMRVDQERAFLRGAVEFFDDEEAAPPAADLQKRAIEGYNQLQALASSEPLNVLEETNPQLSFRLAQPVADLALRQMLLSRRSESERLRLLADFFPSYLLRQQRIQHVKLVAPRNGHARRLTGIE